MNYEKFNYYSNSFEYCLIFHPLVKFPPILHLQRQGGCMLQKKDHWMRILKMQGLVCGGSDSKNVCLQCGRPRFNPWVRKIPWRRMWQPTPVLLPGKFHGWRNLVGYSLWGCKESDTTERLHFQFSLSSHFCHVQLFETPQTVACQTPLSTGSCRQEQQQWVAILVKAVIWQ